MSNCFNLENRTIVLTGATGFLGAEMAKGLVEHGARVILISRSIDKLEAITTNLGSKASYINGDLEDEKFVNSIFQKLKELGVESIEGLVNCAYSGTGGDIDNLDNRAIDKSMKLNVSAPLHLINQLRPLFKESNENFKAIVNISSMYGKIAPHLDVYDSPEKFNPIFYGASKAALIQATKYLACRLNTEGINVNSISPGAFPNPEFNDKSFIEKLEKHVPLQRMGNPEELVGPLVFLLSPAASYVTGTDLAVDGGWTSW